MLCATIPTIGIQTCHAELLISFMSSTIDVGDDGRILVSGFCEPDVRLSRQPRAPQTGVVPSSTAVVRL